MFNGEIYLSIYIKDRQIYKVGERRAEEKRTVAAAQHGQDSSEGKKVKGRRRASLRTVRLPYFFWLGKKIYTYIGYKTILASKGKRKKKKQSVIEHPLSLSMMLCSSGGTSTAHSTQSALYISRSGRFWHNRVAPLRSSVNGTP